MSHRHPDLRILIALGAASAGLSLGVDGARAADLDCPAAVPAALHATFAYPPSGAWSRVAIDLAAPRWRRGGIDGPPAEPEDLKRLLGGSPTLSIGARCTSANLGATHYPCGFRLATVQLAGRALDVASLDPRAGLWKGTSSVLRMQAIGSGVASIALFDEPVDGAPPREVMLGVVSPPIAGLAAADPGRLSFSFRALRNEVMTGRFDGIGHVVIGDSRCAAAARPAREPSRGST